MPELLDSSGRPTAKNQPARACRHSIRKGFWDSQIKALRLCYPAQGQPSPFCVTRWRKPVLGITVDGNLFPRRLPDVFAAGQQHYVDLC